MALTPTPPSTGVSVGFPRPLSVAAAAAAEIDDTINNDDSVYSDLVSWIVSHGGRVHPSLALRSPRDDGYAAAGGGGGRGIFATADIAKGETLIRLPEWLAICGAAMPGRYRCPAPSSGGGGEGEGEGGRGRGRGREGPSVERAASPWLRCVAALISARKRPRRPSDATGDVDFGPYLRSLPPDGFRTLLSRSAWPDGDVRAFLGGTSLGEAALSDRRDGTPRERYEGSVLPYLRQAGNIATEEKEQESGGGRDEGEDGEYGDFLCACEAISTRGFHVRPPRDGGDGDGDADDGGADPSSYSGPYLLPLVDLLNHSSCPRTKCTTLRRSSGFGRGDFVMVAERPIRAGEELLHSYGDDLTAAQCLQTFGFVEGAAMRRAASSGGGSGGSGALRENAGRGNVTPAVLSRSAVLKSCREVAASEYPAGLRAAVERRRRRRQRAQSTKDSGRGDDDGDREEEGGGEDEDEEGEDQTWRIDPERAIPPSALSSAVIPDSLLVAPPSPLSDELVALCCLPFLPDGPFQEWADEPCLWNGEEVLEDYYLGKLALRSVLRAAAERRGEYGRVTAKPAGLEGRAGSEAKAAAATGKGDGGEEEEANDDRRDQRLLARLLAAPPSSSPEVNQRRTRACYGLTVRIEEKLCLRALRDEARRRSDRLDDKDRVNWNGDDGGESCVDGAGGGRGRQQGDDANVDGTELPPPAASSAKKMRTS